MAQPDWSEDFGDLSEQYQESYERMQRMSTQAFDQLKAYKTFSELAEETIRKDLFKPFEELITAGDVIWLRSKFISI